MIPPTRARPPAGWTVVLFLFCAFPSSLAARTLHVPSEYPTISAGLEAAVTGDIVEVACGTYFERAIVMKSGGTLRSETGDPACARIDAEQDDVLLLDQVDGSAAVDGLTFARGTVVCDGSSASFTRCRFVERFGVGGPGAMLCLNGSAPTFGDCLFWMNESFGPGGAIYCEDSSPVFVRCTFDLNFASHYGGGAVSAWYSSPVFTECLFRHNGSQSVASGGVDVVGGSASFTACTFIGNSGAVGLNGASGTLTHCTLVADGYPQGEAATIQLYASTLILESSIVAFNPTAAVSRFPDDTSTASAACCDIYGNTGGDWIGVLEELFGVNANFSLDPLFCGAPSDWGLDSGSPCVVPQLGSGCGEYIGAWSVGCGLASVEGPQGQGGASATTWGGLKALLR